jgi:FHS family L-fucose permease-like MFS transporter
LFFIFGFVTNLNDILIPHLKRACQLNDFQSAFVQFAFFGAYFLMSLPAGAILKKIGYKKGIVLGLVTCMVGALLFLPAANSTEYIYFLFALSVLATGITLLQVAANPYVSVLGPAHQASSRLSIVGTFNSIGASLAPHIGGILILSGIEYSASQIQAMPDVTRMAYLNSEAALVKTPYLVLAGCLLVIALLIHFSRLPEIELEKDDISQGNLKGSVLQYRHLVLGIIAIFTYVGAEVGIGSFIIRYGQSLSIEGFTERMGSSFVRNYMIGAMVGRLIGIVVLPKVSTAKALAFNCAIAVLLIIVSILTQGKFALWCIVLVGLCNSIMWPAIFPLAIEGLGRFTKKGSSLLIMGVVGGALVPLLIGFVSDQAGIKLAFIVPALCYLFILYYGLVGHKPTNLVKP